MNTTYCLNNVCYQNIFDVTMFDVSKAVPLCSDSHVLHVVITVNEIPLIVSLYLSIFCISGI